MFLYFLKKYIYSVAKKKEIKNPFTQTKRTHADFFETHF